MKKIAIVYIAHDGYTSLYTGVGTIARDFLFSFPDVANRLHEANEDHFFDLYATTIKYGKKCFGYSETLKRATLDFIKLHNNIKFIELLNGSHGEESYAGIECWKTASISAATFIYTLSLSYDYVIAIAVDTPFAQVANYYFNQYESTNVEIVWLPQSTVIIHREKKKTLSAVENLRYRWEKDCIEFANKHKQVFIASVGQYMKTHIIKDFGAKPNKIIDLHNSLYLQRLDNNKLSQKSIEKKLKNLGVPTNRPLLFSFGRAEYYKGLDLVLLESLDLIKKYNYFVLILTSPYEDNQKDPTLVMLRSIANKHIRDMKIISTQDFILPHLVMQWKNTKILAILSRAEPFGLIPIESRYYMNQGLTLLISSVGGLMEQVNDGEDGFVTQLKHRDIRASFEKIARLPIGDKKKIVLAGYNKITRLYNQVDNNMKFIKQRLKLL